MACVEFTHTADREYPTVSSNNRVHHSLKLWALIQTILHWLLFTSLGVLWTFHTSALVIDDNSPHLCRQLLSIKLCHHYILGSLLHTYRASHSSHGSSLPLLPLVLLSPIRPIPNNRAKKKKKLNIICADKTSRLVIMDKGDYIHKAAEALNKIPHEVVNKDPNQHIIRKLTALKKKNTLIYPIIIKKKKTLSPPIGFITPTYSVNWKLIKLTNLLDYL